MLHSDRIEALSMPTFFAPTKTFIDYVLGQSATRIIDAGAGMGHVARALSDAGHHQVLAIDMYCRAGADPMVERVDATEFRYQPGDLVLIARPCRGVWIDQVIRIATEAGATVLYITKPKNVELDLDAPLQANGTAIPGEIGDEGEIMLQFSGPQPLPELFPGEALIRLEFWSVACPMIDTGTYWRHRNSFGRFPKNRGEIIVATYADQVAREMEDVPTA
jgi:hypothetical protein